MEYMNTTTEVEMSEIKCERCGQSIWKNGRFATAGHDGGWSMSTHDSATTTCQGTIYFHRPDPRILSREDYETHQAIVARMGRKAPQSVELLNAHREAGGSIANGHVFA